MIAFDDIKRFIVTMMPLILVFSTICILALVDMNEWVRFTIYVVIGFVIIWYQYNIKEMDD